MLELVYCQLKLFVSLGETLASMEETEFSQHVESLATKRLEKPKRLSVSNGRYWLEILSQHYNFNRDDIEVTVTQMDSQRGGKKINYYRLLV